MIDEEEHHARVQDELHRKIIISGNRSPNSAYSVRTVLSEDGQCLGVSYKKDDVQISTRMGMSGIESRLRHQIEGISEPENGKVIVPHDADSSEVRFKVPNDCKLVTGLESLKKMATLGIVFPGATDLYTVKTTGANISLY